MKMGLLSGLLSEVVLEGRFVRLEPLRPSHAEALFAAASEARDTYGLTTVPGSLEGMRAYVAQACEAAASGLALPFATLSRQGDRVVGSTRFCSPERWSWPGEPPAPIPDGPDAVEIGWTWLAASAQRTPINTEAKLLMLTHALERCRLRRVTLKTDARNLRSRAAMERLGLHFDGVLRAHMPASDGGVRDSAYFSVIASEWPQMKARLHRLLRS
jgi:RimJ/RimL family protein N-acetyltransferase